MALRCFVAMAFGHADTDEWFDSVLAPTIRGLGIEVRRVDRIVHNDDVDDRIMSEIESADLAVVDLTYARPSAYFEAGYAQRSVPVIYTVRRDHLDGTAGDPALRVHFDLSVKNIIAWQSPSDQAFAGRLHETLQLVVRPLAIAAAEAGDARAVESRFKQQPVVDQLSEVANSIATAVRKSRVLTVPPRKVWPNPYETASSKFVGSELVGFQMAVLETVTKSTLAGSLKKQLAYPRFNVNPPTMDTRVAGISDLYVFASLGRVPLTRVTSALSIFSVVDETSRHLRWTGEEAWPSVRIGSFRWLRPIVPGIGKFRANDRGVERTIEVREIVEPGHSDYVEIPRVLDVVIIDAIRSGSDAATRVTDAIRRWRPEPLT